MAEIKPGEPQKPAETSPAHQLIIRAQYIKDLSFESPRAPQTLLVQQQQPEVNLSVDVKARNLGPETFEVILTVGAEARQGEEPVFLIEISYGSVVTIQGASPDVVPLLVFVETPRLVFPFARAIIANATRDGGFPPLLVNPIDFAELLRREHEKALKEQQETALQNPTGTA